MDMADDVNKYINDKTPWKKELEEANDIATTALNAFYILTIYLRPILPERTEKVTNFLNQDINSFDDINETLDAFASIREKLENGAYKIASKELAKG